MRVAILGLGVMGGSLARALSGGTLSEGERSRVTGWTPDAEERAIAAGAAVHVAPDLAEAVVDAELIVVATPLSVVAELAVAAAKAAPADALFSDVASLQAPALAAAAAADLAGRWVSAHPLVGSERSGFEASRADLYHDAPIFLSAAAAASSDVRARLAGFWEEVGGSCSWLDAPVHDRLMARVSHLPQLVATALADALAETGLAADQLGPGGRDTTRLAESSTAMWRDLLAHADPALVEGLRAVAARLEADADALEEGNTDVPMERLLRAGRWRSGT